jgi:PAS domain S-box-containing protein
MSRTTAPALCGGSRDRARLLVFSTAILCAVALLSAAVTAFHLAPLAGGQVSDEAARAWFRALSLAGCGTLILVIAGGTLLVRVVNPFVRRLEESEAQLRAIVSTAGDGIVTLDRRGTIHSVNRTAERMFGCREAAMLGHSVDRWILLATGLGFARDVAAGADSGDASRKAVGRGAGRTFPIELSISRVTAGEPALFTVIVRDTTDRETVHERLRRQMLKLEEVKETLEAKAAELARTNRDLDDFTYIASHDLKEPLRGISAYCRLLLDDYGGQLDADGQRRLQALIGLCQRLSRLVDDVLAYSQIGSRQPEVAETDLNELVADVLETLAPAIDERRALVCASGVLPKVGADRVGLGEVFRNLITNALKFNDSPQPKVEIGCLGEAIYVRDNGIGIAPCHHEAIFAMFRRLHGRGQYEGTGAGLSLVRKIVEAHGGRVWLESHPGRGSTFYFTLSENLAPPEINAPLVPSAAPNLRAPASKY